MVGRILGWSFIGLALICLGADAMAMLERGRLGLLPLGDLWLALDAEGYAGMRLTIETYTLPALWTPVAMVLKVPGLLLFGLLGLLLLLVCRRREPVAKRFS